MFVSNISFGDTFESLLMPGALSLVHQEYEGDCEQCHDTADKDKQGMLCVQCHDHENILDDISNKTGFHGRIPELLRTDCKHCHVDHEGRDAKLILFDASTFNHEKTDFQLKGQHAKTKCNACHIEDKKYSEAPNTCYSCHEDSDVHDGKQGKKCQSCHSEINWKKTAFNHDKTDFPLKGAHQEVRCDVCHINKKYKDTSKTCFSCHQINDIHQGSFGKKCDSCHSEKKWKKVSFDHDKKTDFPLSGKHKKASCNSCHVNGIGKRKNKDKLPTSCHGCHKNDDDHKGQYGEKCESCHVPSSWKKQKFDHDRETNFSLLGKHGKLSCQRCHTGSLYEDELMTACVDCHKTDDVHKGKQGKECGSCHNETGWRNNVSFDHDLSSFPLIGMHAVTQCEECHLDSEHGSVETECIQCHGDDDVHEKRLGGDCHTCHTPNSWDAWFFDHEKSTRFKIDGAHEELGCYDCHKEKFDNKLDASKDCVSCHRSQDVHSGQFGRHCDDCHNTTNFKDINIIH